MSVYLDMRDEIVTLLGTVQLDASAALPHIATAPIRQYTSTPAATVVPSDIASEYLNVTENLRDYGFNIHLHVPVNENEEWDTEIDVMIRLIDAVLDVLDQSRDLNAKADFLRAVPMEWDIAEGPGGLEIMATIRVIARKAITV